MKIACNIGRCRWFSPDGKLHHFGTRDNPRTWTSKSTLSARLFVGFKVGDRVRWKLSDLIRIVRSVRESQVHDPSSTFVLQRGIYKHQDGSGKVIVEPGAQAIIIDTSGTKRAEFASQMQTLAEDIARKLRQESVVVELQRNGVAIETFGVAA